MCVISDNIKLCSCARGSINSMDNYWIIYRLGKPKEILALGMPSMPQGWLDNNYELNRQIILTRLNESDVFDMALELKNNDKLHIVFNNLFNAKQEIIYAFKFRNSNWVEDEYDWFELKNHNHKKIARGIIEKQ